MRVRSLRLSIKRTLLRHRLRGLYLRLNAPRPETKGAHVGPLSTFRIIGLYYSYFRREECATVSECEQAVRGGL